MRSRPSSGLPLRRPLRPSCEVGPLIRKSLPQASMRILKARRRSPLGLSLYKWLFYKTFPLYSQKSRPSFFRGTGSTGSLGPILSNGLIFGD